MNQNNPKLAPYLARQWPWLLITLIGGILQNTLNVLPPILSGQMIDTLVKLGQGMNEDLSRHFFWLIAVYGGATIIFCFGRHYKRFAITFLSNKVGTMIRHDLLGRIVRWPLARFDQEQKGDLTARLIDDVELLVNAITQALYEAIDAGFMVVFNTAVLLFLEPVLTVLCLLPLGLMQVVSMLFRKRIVNAAAENRASVSTLSNQLEHGIRGVRVLRMLGLEEMNLGQLEEKAAGVRKKAVRLATLQNSIIPLYSFFTSLGFLAVLWYGGSKVASGGWSIGSFTGFMGIYSWLALRMFWSVRAQSVIFTGQAAWRRIKAKLLQNEPDLSIQSSDVAMNQPLNQVAIPENAPLTISLRNLSFSYPGRSEQVLSDINLELPAGSFTAITGPIGSGKSALAAALLGAYPYKGSIQFNGIELAQIPASEQARIRSFMGQEEYLFSRSIADNISFQNEQVERQRLEEAAHWAGLSDDLSLFATGFETAVGEGGVTVSGGQRQRIALARALYPSTGFVILDDPFSAVDLETEHRIIARLRTAFAGRTILLFSHRLSSFPMADQIVVLSNGTIAETGTHKELLGRPDGLYATIYAAQQWLQEHKA